MNIQIRNIIKKIANDEKCHLLIVSNIPSILGLHVPNTSIYNSKKGIQKIKNLFEVEDHYDINESSRKQIIDFIRLCIKDNCLHDIYILSLLTKITKIYLENKISSSEYVNLFTMIKNNNRGTGIVGLTIVLVYWMQIDLYEENEEWRKEDDCFLGEKELYKEAKEFYPYLLNRLDEALNILETEGVDAVEAKLADLDFIIEKPKVSGIFTILQKFKNILGLLKQSKRNKNNK